MKKHEIQTIGDINAVEILKNDVPKSVMVLPANRLKTKSNVKTIESSVKEIGHKHRFPLVYLDKKENKFVLYDGNHILEVLMNDENKKSITFIVNTEISTKEQARKAMVLLNNTGKKWVVLDYARSFSDTNENYQTILKEIDKKKKELKHNLQLTTIIMAYSQSTERLSTTKDFKNGKFVIKDKDFGDKLLNNIDECKDYIEDTRQVSEVLLKIMLTHKKYNQSKMIKNLKQYKDNIRLSTKEKELYEQLLNIYLK